MKWFSRKVPKGFTTISAGQVLVIYLMDTEMYFSGWSVDSQHGHPTWVIHHTDAKKYTEGVSDELTEDLWWLRNHKDKFRVTATNEEQGWR